MRRVKGSELPANLQRECLARFIYRSTGDHIPCWHTGRYRLQFRDDKDWLENTYFYVTNAGKLAIKPSHCESHPTWPDGRNVRVVKTA